MQTTKPRLLDLYCGAGGSARGYQMAGFHVTGVDNRPMPRYSGDAYIQADALEYIKEHGSDYEAIHASPPCQRFSSVTRVNGDPASYPDLIAATRASLLLTGARYVIENVPGALRELRDPVVICGSMFDPLMDVQRHRLFETNWRLAPPQWPCRHALWGYRYISLDQRRRRASRVVQVHGGAQFKLAPIVGVSVDADHAGEFELRKRAMGINWMTSVELNQAIPPAYTAFVGVQLRNAIG